MVDTSSATYIIVLLQVVRDFLIRLNDHVIDHKLTLLTKLKALGAIEKTRFSNLPTIST